MDDQHQRSAFALDAVGQRAKAAAKAAWWSATGGLARAITGRPRASRRAASSRKALPSPRNACAASIWKPSRRTPADVAAGLYPAVEDAPTRPIKSLLRALDFLVDARTVDQRRRRGDGVEVRSEPETEAYPNYYRQNFHYQSGGWFTPESARRYDAQVEALFAGTAGAMRRRGLALLAKHWRGTRSPRPEAGRCGLRIGRVPAGPEGRLSARGDRGPGSVAAYLAKARRRSGVATVQANIESLPFADGALDAVSCVYLFHELPPRVRPVVAAAIARVVEAGRRTGLRRLRAACRRAGSGAAAGSLPGLFPRALLFDLRPDRSGRPVQRRGPAVVDQDQAFLTKAMLFEKV
jgi:hypothetical protein